VSEPIKAADGIYVVHPNGSIVSLPSLPAKAGFRLATAADLTSPAPTVVALPEPKAAKVVPDPVVVEHEHAAKHVKK
jgi:hypothetical protein